MKIGRPVSKVFRGLTIAIIAAALFSPLPAEAQSRIEGDWKGSFEVDGTTLRLVLHIRPAPNGSLNATLDSVDQDSPNIPVNFITFQNTTLKLDIAQVQAAFEGKLSKDGNEIKGQWLEGKRRALDFKRVTESTSSKPPTPIGGIWEGTLVANGKQSQIVLHLDAEHYTKLSASLEGLADSSSGTSVSETTFTDNALRFSVDSLHVSYFGAATEDGNEIVGVWTQGGSVPLTLRRVAQDTNPIVLSEKTMAARLLVYATPPLSKPTPASHCSNALAVARVIVDEGGKVSSADYVSGYEELKESTLATVRLWSYKPYIADGKPVVVETRASIFYLGDGESMPMYAPDGEGGAKGGNTLPLPPDCGSGPQIKRSN